MALSDYIVVHRVTEVENGDIREAYHKENRRKILFIVLMILVTVFCFFLTISVGNHSTSISEAISVIWNELTGGYVSSDNDHYLWGLYVPRALGTIVVAAGLAIGGVVMQNLLRNPLAEPYTMGVASGAMFGVSLSIAFGFTIIPGLTGTAATMANSFVFALIPVAIISVVAAVKKISPLMMILTGIAVMFLFNTINQFIMVVVDSESLQEIYVWGMGATSRIGWEELAVITPVVIVVSIVLYAMSSKLDVMYSGDRNAQSLGIKAKLFRLVMMVLVSLLTAAVVCCCGTIGFVGLVAPHIARMFVGSNNRYLMPAAAAFAMAFLLCADTVVKVWGTGGLPVGVVTSLVGGPMFIFILLKMRKTAWM